MNVKLARAPPYMRHPCRHRADDRHRIPNLASTPAFNASSTAHATVLVCSEKDAATLPSQSLEEQDTISLPCPGCQEIIAPIESHEDTRNTATHTSMGGSSPVAPRLSHRRERPENRRQTHLATASRMNQARLFSGHQSDHDGGMSQDGSRSYRLTREPLAPSTMRRPHVHFNMHQLSREFVRRALMNWNWNDTLTAIPWKPTTSPGAPSIAWTKLSPGGP